MVNNDYLNLVYRAKQVLLLLTDENKQVYQYLNKMVTYRSLKMFLGSREFLKKFSKVLSPETTFRINCMLGSFMPQRPKMDDTYALIDADAIRIRAISTEAQLNYYDHVGKRAMSDSSLTIGPQPTLSLVA